MRYKLAHDSMTNLPMVLVMFNSTDEDHLVFEVSTEYLFRLLVSGGKKFAEFVNDTAKSRFPDYGNDAQWMMSLVIIRVLGEAAEEIRTSVECPEVRWGDGL